MFFKKKPKPDVPSSPNLQEINQEIYKHNVELAVVNKTLSLLRKLYQISLLELDPNSLSEKISDTVRVELNMEVAGVFAFDEKNDSLVPFKFSSSERLLASLAKQGFLSKDFTITALSQKPYLHRVIYEKQSIVTDSMENVWGGEIESSKLKTVTTESNIKTILLYPLVTQNRIIGMLLLGLNRNYESLSEREQDSIKSLIDVVAVALDKAQLYEQLRIANDELKTLDRARAEFISIASHQLRTPPSTIKWYLAAVTSGDFGKVNPKALEAIRKVEITNNGLISLIDDLLNVSRIERGKMEFLFEETSFNDLVQAAVDQLQPQAITKKLKLAYSAPKAKLPKIVADKEKLKQVVNNLIDNAIKYSKKGSVKVKLVHEGDELSLTVTDTGKGMSTEELGQIFEKFKRGKDSMHQAAGLGLGLYVAKVVVEHHHGKIWADSPGVGLGSTFHVTLPIHTDLTAEAVLDLTQEMAGKK